MRRLGTVPGNSCQKAVVIYKDSGETGVESKIEDWKTGGSISGEATRTDAFYQEKQVKHLFFLKSLTIQNLSTGYD